MESLETLEELNTATVVGDEQFEHSRPKLVKEELRRQPKKVILSEVRQVVQQMQAVHQHLEEALERSDS
ncbi:hypothetical protein PVAP13_9NG112492 [Panicum virgatum]|uniref:Uncharacterized protein n=1 Tax=Panicum virgatum TaxID=38727 RepID=A0A8T0MEB9_PANVG|nr:hypothetical protein PVAP13_9NG112492 [Panicum virgatum]